MLRRLHLELPGLPTPRQPGKWEVIAVPPEKLNDIKTGELVEVITAHGEAVKALVIGRKPRSPWLVVTAITEENVDLYLSVQEPCYWQQIEARRARSKDGMPDRC